MSRKPARSKTPTFRPRTVELDILAIGARGDGLAKLDGEQVFVPMTLAGDRVIARLEGRRGDGLTATPLEILSVGPTRREPPCELFGRCGGLGRVEARKTGHCANARRVR
jgi:23S rRNA (uracil1939-C5)-methyltransferase